MRTRGDGVGTAVHEVAEHASALARLEAELATLEVRAKLRSLGLGGGLSVGAAVIGLFALGFLFATIVAGLATFLDPWLALLIVAVALFIAAAGLGAAGVSSLRRGVPPVPEGAVAEAKLTAKALKGNGRA
jgi:hypothetical protein